MNRRRLLQTAILVVGLVGIGLAVAESVDQANEKVLPSVDTIVIAGVLALIAIAASARAWVALFSDLMPTESHRNALRGTFYLAQLTKYVPAGGILQATSQLSLAKAAGVPLRRAVVAYPVSAIGAIVAGATLSSGLALDSGQPGWIRLLALAGLGTLVFLHRGLLGAFLNFAHRRIARIPDAELLPTQRDILIFYLWALATIGALSLGYTIMLGSLSDAAPYTVFCSFAAAFVIGFAAIPIPAGVGIREAVLVVLIPGVGTGPLLAVSLVLRLLSIGTELLALLANKLFARRHPPATIGVTTPPAPAAPEA
jgi:glycosyltransferase 2 family protein